VAVRAVQTACSPPIALVWPERASFDSLKCTLTFSSSLKKKGGYFVEKFKEACLLNIPYLINKLEKQ
jgi:hypothetical protein